nr:indolepyruvate ferredoxin oxidoreductase family protein [Bryobacter sp.]
MIHTVAGPSNTDGVLGLWYGKGPGLDRSGDALRHANLAGVPSSCAALVLAGDDHASKSSTIPHQSDFSLFNLAIPTFAPGNTQEVLDHGLAAAALSRYTGAWSALKLVTAVCDGGGTVTVDPERLRFVFPGGYQKASDPRLVIPHTVAMERETNHRRLEAARHFIAINKLNRIHGGAARFGIAAAGKAFYDLLQALRDLGLSDLERHGLRLAQFAVTFPLDPEFVREFSRGLDTILVVEEKRSFLELQLREALYGLAAAPPILGKQDAAGQPLLPAHGELDPERIASALAQLIPGLTPPPPFELLDAVARRAPNYCSGCPHNRSTLLLDGQIAGGGTGCHGMGMLLGDAHRGYEFATHMGGEGAPWIGMAPFTERKHVFQNMGDGTYFHSGALAVRACAAAGVNITFKLLYNGHVAMTGGQLPAGQIAVPELTRRLEADGVLRTVVLTEDPESYREVRHRLAESAEILDRLELPRVLRELEATPGVTAIIYDQECAAERRRKRARGKEPEPVFRLLINEEVCEGCGDCVTQSNCMSLQPVATPFGQKMRIHQSSCNKDLTCALGDCPAFVTVKIKPGTGLPEHDLPVLADSEIPPPSSIAPVTEDGYRIVMPGIGGTGVVTINALLATAAWLDSLDVTTLDQTGLAQKGGAVVSHLVLSRGPWTGAARAPRNSADLLLGFDLLGAAAHESLAAADPSRTVAVLNTELTPTAVMIRKPALLKSPGRALELLTTRTRQLIPVDAARLAESLFGSHLATNIFLLGVAWQAGLVPVSLRSLEEAIELNNVEVDRNLAAFRWGRRYHVNPAAVEQLAPRPTVETEDPLALRERELTAYRNAAYAREWRAFVDRVAARSPRLAETAAPMLFKLMAYKDEYEVARLLTKPAFERHVHASFAAVEWHGYNLLPPFLRGLGRKRKLTAGPWLRPWLRVLARLKFLRGTALDPFGWSAERREERELIRWYRELIVELMERLTPTNESAILELAAAPDAIRGYGDLKRRSARETRDRVAAALRNLPA